MWCAHFRVEGLRTLSSLARKQEQQEGQGRGQKLQRGQRQREGQELQRGRRGELEGEGQQLRRLQVGLQLQRGQQEARLGQGQQEGQELQWGQQEARLGQGQQEGQELQQGQGQWELLGGAAVGGSAPLNLVFRDQSGSEVHFRVWPHTKMHKVLQAYCQKKSLEQGSVRFVFDGFRVGQEETPAERRGMEDGDIVEVYSEQAGD